MYWTHEVGILPVLPVQIEQACAAEGVLRRRQSGDLHRSVAEVSSFSLLGAVRRDEIDYRLSATGISLRTEDPRLSDRRSMAARAMRLTTSSQI